METKKGRPRTGLPTKDQLKKIESAKRGDPHAHKANEANFDIVNMSSNDLWDDTMSRSAFLSSGIPTQSRKPVMSPIRLTSKPVGTRTSTAGRLR